jgi:hypothetical protein
MITIVHSEFRIDYYSDTSSFSMYDTMPEIKAIPDTTFSKVEPIIMARYNK